MALANDVRPNSLPDTFTGAAISIRGMTLALNPNAKDDITEEQWRQSWQQFWVAANEEPRSNQEWRTHADHNAALVYYAAEAA